MTTIVNCPECRRALQVPENYFGQKVQCPDCKNTFVANPPEAAIQVAPPPAPGPASAPPAAEKQRRRNSAMTTMTTGDAGATSTMTTTTIWTISALAAGAINRSIPIAAASS